MDMAKKGACKGSLPATNEGSALDIAQFLLLLRMRRAKIISSVRGAGESAKWIGQLASAISAEVSVDGALAQRTIMSETPTRWNQILTMCHHICLVY
jgi:hypothetical protein